MVVLAPQPSSMDKWEAVKEEVVVHQLASRRQGACTSHGQRPKILRSTIVHILSGVGAMGGNIATTERESRSRLCGPVCGASAGPRVAVGGRRGREGERVRVGSAACVGASATGEREARGVGRVGCPSRSPAGGPRNAFRLPRNAYELAHARALATRQAPYRRKAVLSPHASCCHCELDLVVRLRGRPRLDKSRSHPAELACSSGERG